MANKSRGEDEKSWLIRANGKAEEHEKSWLIRAGGEEEEHEKSWLIRAGGDEGRKNVCLSANLLPYRRGEERCGMDNIERWRKGAGQGAGRHLSLPDALTSPSLL